MRTSPADQRFTSKVPAPSAIDPAAAHLRCKSKRLDIETSWKKGEWWSEQEPGRIFVDNINPNAHCLNFILNCNITLGVQKTSSIANKHLFSSLAWISLQKLQAIEPLLSFYWIKYVREGRGFQGSLILKPNQDMQHNFLQNQASKLKIAPKSVLLHRDRTAHTLLHHAHGMKRGIRK